MANENLDDSLIPIAIQNLTKHTTEEECCKAYGPWAKTYSKVILLVEIPAKPLCLT